MFEIPFSGSLGASAYRGRENAVSVMRIAKVVWVVAWLIVVALFGSAYMVLALSDMSYICFGLVLTLAFSFFDLSNMAGALAARICFGSYVSMLCGNRMADVCSVDEQMSVGRPSRSFTVSGVMVSVDDVRVGPIPGGVVGVVVSCTLRNSTNEVRVFDPSCVRVMGASGRAAKFLPNLCTDELCSLHLAPGEAVSGLLMFSHVRPVSVDVIFLGDRLLRGLLSV